jgi:hypothetical protein
MATEPLFFLGLVLLCLGVATISLRGVRGLARRLFLTGGLAFLVAGSMLLLIARDKHRFRVTEIRFSVGTQYTGTCPAKKRVLVEVQTTGGAGDLAIRVWADQDYDTPVKNLRVRPEQSVQVYADVEVTRSGIVRAYASVEAPNDGLASAVFRAECTPSPA